MLLDRILKIHTNNKGQATVEAAIMIPVIFIILLLLIEPGILFYDYCVMNSAAAETCRVLSTQDNNNKQKVCEAFARRRLSAIPQQDNFHLHSTGCSYQIQLEGSQDSNEVSVKIINEVKPLPLIGFLSDVLGILNANKCFEINANCTQKQRPDWVKTSIKDTKIEELVGKCIN